MKAVCATCLSLLSIDEGTLVEAAKGRRASPIYASDDLAFPGIGLPGVASGCPRCGTSVPIAVDDDVAATLPRS